MTRWRWVFLLLILLAAAFFVLNRTVVLDGLIPRQQKIEVLNLTVGALSDGLNIVFILANLIAFLFPRRERTKGDDEAFANLLVQANRAYLQANYGAELWDHITWVDRGIVNVETLRRYKKIVLVGAMKSGKSREAAELVHRALADNLVSPGAVFDITCGVTTPAELLRSELGRKLHRGAGALFYADNLSKQTTEKYILALDEYLKALDACEPGYFVATARSDHLVVAERLKKWLADHQIRVVEMKPLVPKDALDLARELAPYYGLDLPDGACAILAEHSDGTPYHTITALALLRQKPQPVSDETVRAVASQSTETIWDEIRAVLVRLEPATASLLQALAVFYHANLRPEHVIVLAYAQHLERRRRPWAMPWQVQRGMATALELVQRYGITFTNPFVFPDVAVESLSNAREAVAEITLFLRGYRKLFRNPILRRFNPQATAAQNALRDLAGVLYTRGAVAQAEEMLLLAAAVKRPDAALHFYLGLYAKELGKSHQAVAAYRQAIALDPKHAAAHNNLGNLYGEQGKAAEAEAAYRQAIALDPEHAAVHYNLGNLYREQGKAAEAEAAYRQAIALDPKHAGTHNNLGNLYGEQGKAAEAEAAYRQAIALDPKHAAAHYNLGVLYGEQGKAAEAEGAYRQAIALDPEYAAAHNNLGLLYGEQGKAAEAEGAYRLAIALDPRLAAAHNNLGNLYHEQGKAAEAEVAFRQAIALDPEYAAAHNNLGVLYGKQGKAAEAEAAYRQAIALDPEYAAAHNNLGVLYGEQGKAAEAEAAFCQAIALNPRLAAAHNNLGWLLRRMGRIAEALEVYRAAAEAFPEKVSFHAGLGWLYRKSGRLDDAERVLAAARRLGASASRYDQACVAALSGDTQSALALLKEALDTGRVERAWVRQNPDWDDLRDDPRFREIVEGET